MAKIATVLRGSLAELFELGLPTTHPASIHLEGGTQPSTAKRGLAIADTQQEIECKKAVGQPLVPKRQSPD
jgi:hypothetical protein